MKVIMFLFTLLKACAQFSSLCGAVTSKALGASNTLLITST